MSLKRNNNLTHKYDETYDGKQQVLKKHFVQCLFYSNIDEKKKNRFPPGAAVCGLSFSPRVRGVFPGAWFSPTSQGCA